MSNEPQPKYMKYESSQLNLMMTMKVLTFLFNEGTMAIILNFKSILSMDNINVIPT
jgi:hypothetical protein